MSIIQPSSFKIQEYQKCSKYIKTISHCKDFSEFLSLDEEIVISCLRKNFLEEISDHNQEFAFTKDNAFFSLLKNWAVAHNNLAVFLSQTRDRDSNSYSMISNMDSNLHKNQGSQQEVNRRKVTRLFHAMRNVKNQQQLKKDQIFVRLIPRSQTCIQFMLNNRNFPRIELKLSCNQHLEYLVNYLTNKWLRGKVGVGYQIVLYPDPSSYLKKNKNIEEKRSQVVHQPLNNYLMFTDIMSGYGASQNACINVYYDITELRKDKSKTVQKQKQYLVNEFRQKNPEREALQNQSSDHPPSERNFFKLNSMNIEKRIEQNARDFLENSYDDHSLNLRGFSKKFGHDDHYDQNSLNHRNIEEEDYGSLAFNWNAYNSNLIGASNHLFYNNSNTFLNAQPHQFHENKPDEKEKQKRQKIDEELISEHEDEENNEVESQGQKQKKVCEQQSRKMLIKDEESEQKPDKLDHIRNVISMIGMQAGGQQKEHPLEQREQNSVQNHRSNSSLPLKQVKMVQVIRKKN